MFNKLIILDRDGVINQDSDQFIKSPEEWIPLQGSAEAIAKLNNAGYKIGIATNQSGIGRGLFDNTMLESIHKKMSDHLAEHGAYIDKLIFCPDHPDSPGANRKPAPGMAVALLETFSAVPGDTWFVGDSLADVLSAINAGCKPALVETGKGIKTKLRPEIAVHNVPVFKDLAEFVEWLLN